MLSEDTLLCGSSTWYLCFSTCDIWQLRCSHDCLWCTLRCRI